MSWPCIFGGECRPHGPEGSGLENLFLQVVERLKQALKRSDELSLRR
jgi:hypothetical protein